MGSIETKIRWLETLDILLQHKLVNEWMSTKPVNSGKKAANRNWFEIGFLNHEQLASSLPKNPPLTPCEHIMWSTCRKAMAPHHRLCFFGGSFLAETKNPKMCWSKPGINSSTLLNPGSGCHATIEKKWCVVVLDDDKPLRHWKKMVKLVYPPTHWKTNGWPVGLPGENIWPPSFQAPQLFAATCDIAERGIIVLWGTTR